MFLPLEGIKLTDYTDKGVEKAPEAAPQPAPESGGIALITGVPHLCIIVNITATKPKRAGKYVLGKVLGKGSFGTVRVGQNTLTGARFSYNV